MLDPKSVIVGMSGGVDSSVAVELLKRDGMIVTGLTITPFKATAECKSDDNAKSCCSYKSLRDAVLISKKLGVPHKFVNSSDDFRVRIVQYFIDEYIAGHTPNPCVECNKYIKWDALLRKADEIGAKYVATGHYAKIRQNPENGRYTIAKGDDGTKDQSYFLWELNQNALSRTLFPLANYEKTRIREIASELDLIVANKSDSQEICFVPDDDYTNFLKDNVEGIEKLFETGDILFKGEVIGKHKGYPFYTIGQRRGLGISYPEPLYVLKIDAESNTIEVGTDDMLFKDGLKAVDLNFMRDETLIENKEYDVKIRYRDSGAPALCKIDADGALIVKFIKPRRAISPGQSVVIYDNNEIVAGGIIKEVL